MCRGGHGRNVPRSPRPPASFHCVTYPNHPSATRAYRLSSSYATSPTILSEVAETLSIVSSGV